jgi:hypothetical protein
MLLKNNKQKEMRMTQKGNSWTMILSGATSFRNINDYLIQATIPKPNLHHIETQPNHQHLW